MTLCFVNVQRSYKFQYVIIREINLAIVSKSSKLGKELLFRCAFRSKEFIEEITIFKKVFLTDF